MGSDSVVICIAEAPEERSRLAGLFDGVGVLVIASDSRKAAEFLAGLAAPSEQDELVQVGGLAIDLSRYEATWRGEPLQLTQYELKVLACLADRPGQVWTYEQLHDHVWNGSYFTGPAAAQSVVKRLRLKLRQAGVNLRLEAARGLGFRLVDPDLT